ncbi:protein kinase [Streptomyces bobili]|uniref:protein kinase domain-containing protein n=1 Tax=Streptomyces bobili TaxID=67280 RepID=UPI0036F7FFEB
MTFPADPGGPGEDLVPPTLFEPETPSGGLPAPDPRGDPDTLPPTLATRFLARERLPRRGEQTVHRAGEEGRSAELRAAVFRVLDQRAAGPDTERVLKWFHPDAAPDDEVTGLLSEPLHDGLSYVLERGRANGAPFHVLPSHGSTDFATFLRDHGKLSSQEIQGLVARLHGALTALHAAGVVHRDLKPSNLVLGDYARPAEGLVLIDFGISLVARSPREASGTWAATPRYASPQALLRKPIVRAADDWWSLGVLVAEAARGRHPVERHHEPASVMDAVQAGALDLDGITDGHVRLLCQGLLAHHPDDRWGSEQVAEWLAGRSPRAVPRLGPVPRTGDRTADHAAAPGPAPEAPRFEHAGRVFTDPARLGEEFDADWPAMVRRLARGRERERLGLWLTEFRPERDPVRAEALDALLREGLRRRPDAGTLIDLIGWMAPQQEPGYRGIPLGLGDLPAFASRAAAGDRQCVDVMAELHRHRLLDRLAARRGGEELAHVDRRWQDHHAQWDAAVARLAGIPEVTDDRDGLRAATGTGAALTAELLHLAATPAQATRRLRADLERALRAMPAHVSWFARLAEDAREPVPLLLALRLHPLALAQAREIRRERERNRQLAATDAHSRHFRLVQRRLELPVMLGRAAGGALLLFFPHAFVVGLADVTGRAPQTTVLTAWLLSVPSLAALLAVECWTAWYIGARYHPDYSVMGQLTRRSLPVTGRITRRGWRGRLWAGLALVAVAGTVVGTFLLAVWIWPAATVLALLVSSVLRVRAWNARLAAVRGGGRPLTGAGSANGGGDGNGRGGGGATVPGARQPLGSARLGTPSGAGTPADPGSASDPHPRAGSPAGSPSGSPSGSPAGSPAGSPSGGVA